MTYLVRIANAWPLALSLTLIIGLSGCEKESVAVAQGTIETSILPAGQVTLVTATSAAGQVYEVAPDGTTGRFSFAQLPAGTYTLSVKPTAAYKVPEPVKVEVIAGGTARPKLNVLTRDHRLRGTFRWTHDGTTYTAANLYGEVSPSFFSLDGFVKVAGAGHEVGIVIPGYGTRQPFRGVGTYHLGLEEFLFGIYTYTPQEEYWRYVTPQGNTPTGTITITRYDDYSVAGTFEFEAWPFANPKGVPGTVKLAQGSFDVTY